MLSAADRPLHGARSAAPVRFGRWRVTRERRYLVV